MDIPDKGLVTRFDNLFHRVVNKMNRIEKIPRHFGTDFLLYASEIHTIEIIGDNPGISITGLSDLQGVTKGAVSQVIRKLEKKHLVIKMRGMNSEKQVFLKLSDSGKVAWQAHQHFHEAMFPELFETLNRADPKALDQFEKILTAIDSACDRILSQT